MALPKLPSLEDEIKSDLNEKDSKKDSTRDLLSKENKESKGGGLPKFYSDLDNNSKPVKNKKTKSQGLPIFKSTLTEEPIKKDIPNENRDDEASENASISSEASEILNDEKTDVKEKSTPKENAGINYNNRVEPLERKETQIVDSSENKSFEDLEGTLESENNKVDIEDKIEDEIDVIDDNDFSKIETTESDFEKIDKDEEDTLKVLSDSELRARKVEPGNADEYISDSEFDSEELDEIPDDMQGSDFFKILPSAEQIDDFDEEDFDDQENYESKEYDNNNKEKSADEKAKEFFSNLSSKIFKNKSKPKKKKEKIGPKINYRRVLILIVGALIILSIPFIGIGFYKKQFTQISEIEPVQLENENNLNLLVNDFKFEADNLEFTLENKADISANLFLEIIIKEEALVPLTENKYRCVSDIISLEPGTTSSMTVACKDLKKDTDYKITVKEVLLP